MLNEPRGRLAYLDGMRGVAILLVLLFHAFARWPDLVPYGDQYQSVPLFRVGFIGVNLFFIISGFVILMTLESVHLSKYYSPADGYGSSRRCSSVQLSFLQPRRFSPSAPLANRCGGDDVH